MKCINNPKSNEIVERFHFTLIERLQIINQKIELKNASNENKINLALICSRLMPNKFSRQFGRQINASRIVICRT